jgi:hypothetical protein
VINISLGNGGYSCGFIVHIILVDMDRDVEKQPATLGNSGKVQIYYNDIKTRVHTTAMPIHAISPHHISFREDIYGRVQEMKST